MKRTKNTEPVSISITGRHTNITPNIRDYADKKVSRLQKYFDRLMEARIIVSSEKLNQIVEVNISANGFNLSGKGKTSDVYASIDQVVDKLEKQLKKHHEKLLERKRIASQHKLAEKERSFPSRERFDDVIEENRIVKIERVNSKPMSPDEAAMQMDLIEKPFLAFVNSNTEEINVIYRRNDGDYTMITRK